MLKVLTNSSLQNLQLEGMSPPVPGTGRHSNRDTANSTWPNNTPTALHRLTYASRTLPCKIHGCSSAFALAMVLRKSAVSWDPTTSNFGQDNQAGPLPSPESSGCRTSTMPEGQPVNDDLNTACIQLVEGSQVQISDEPVHTNASACLPAHLSCRPFHGKTLASQHPSPRTTLRDGGHKCQESGHIGRCARSREAGERGVCTTTLGKVVGRFKSPGWWAKRSKLLTLRGPLRSEERLIGVSEGGPTPPS